MRAAFIVLAVVAVLSVSLRADAGAASAQATLAWRACGGGFECSTLTVPLDYALPAGRTVDLALIRKPAAQPAQRIGSLVTDPGGPGGSGVQFARAWAGSLAPEITDRFDIVGFDPRGVGASSPVVCHDSLQAYIAADPSPDSQAEWDQLVKVNKDFADACAQKYGDFLQHLGTKDVARDLERIRIALGEPKLTYLGYSYGTAIGQAYLDQFPMNVRAMVLDGAVTLAGDVDGRGLEQSRGFEKAMDAFIADCLKLNCPLTKYGDPAKAVSDVSAKAEAAPIPSKTADRPAGPGEVLYGLIEPLYSKGRWFELARAVDAGLGGDGSRLVELTDDYLGRNGNGYDNQSETNIAVNCIDQAASKLPTEYKDYPPVAAEYAKASPRFGSSLATGLTCKFWPAKPDPLGPVTSTGMPPIVVVSTTGDPATPYAWGVAVSKQIPGAVLLTFGGEGHTAYGGRNQCIDAAVNAYLINLKTPPPNTVCGDPALLPPATDEPTPTSSPSTSATPNGTASPSPTPRPSGTPTIRPTPRPTRPTTPAAPSSGSTGGDGFRFPWFWATTVVIGLAFAGGGTLIALRRIAADRPPPRME